MRYSLRASEARTFVAKNGFGIYSYKGTYEALTEDEKITFNVMDKHREAYIVKA